MQHPQPNPVCFPLDADMTDLILTTLTDIHSLESFVLSSKFVYNVFESRRAFVLCTVVSNHLGPALPPAMRLLKVMSNVNSYWHGWLSPLPVDKLPREEDFRPDDLRMVATMREARMLAANHDIVQELESLYSWRNKDPRSRSSLLTPQESERFQTALYSVWLACTLYGRPAPVNRVRKSKTKRLTEILKNLGQMQAKFMQSLEPSQMGPFMGGWIFMANLAKWAVRAQFFPPAQKYLSIEAYLVWSGPRTTLRAYQGKLKSVDRKVFPSLSASYEQFYKIFAAMSWRTETKITILPSMKEYFPGALRCDGCGRKRLPYLWSKLNWSDLRGVIPPSVFAWNLQLPRCKSYPDAAALEKIFCSVPYDQLIGRVFAHLSEKWKASGWKPEYWLCGSCLLLLMRVNAEAFYQSQGFHIFA